jgi:peptidoglycan/LPS O-acetylase OafA/YrhL
MQFYVGVALLVGLFGRKALFALPLLCLAVTGYRIWYGAYIDIVTWRRLDEILAGCTLALIYFNHLGTQSKIAISKLSVLLLLVLLAIASSPLAGPINYLRPYIAALLVGTSLLSPFPRFGSILKSRFLSYIAAVSYALYVIHGVMVHTWFGDGDKIEKYLKRPVLLAVTFALAHFSTFYFESKFIRLGKKISRRFPVNS